MIILINLSSPALPHYPHQILFPLFVWFFPHISSQCYQQQQQQQQQKEKKRKKKFTTFFTITELSRFLSGLIVDMTFFIHH